MKTIKWILSLMVYCILACLAAPAATLCVWQDSPNAGPPYDTWSTAARTIQDAVDTARPGDIVLVTNGVYSSIWIDRPIILVSANGPEATVIDGGGTNRCVLLATNAILSGFTLTNGCADQGGGVWCGSGAVVTNCVVTGNAIIGEGGCAWRCWDSFGGGAFGGTLYNCTLTGNSAPKGGGAYGSILYNCRLMRNSVMWPCAIPSRGDGVGGGASACTMYSCSLSANKAWRGGGADTSTLFDCSLIDNSAWDGGGGADACVMYCCSLTGNEAWQGGGISDSSLFSCGLSGNMAWDDGGGTCNSTLYNSTLTGNSAGKRGGGVLGGAHYNCIVYHNTAPSAPNHADATFEYSCTTPLAAGVGNIADDPQLASITHLSTSSPCIGAGSLALSAGMDIDGEPWLDPPCMGADQVILGGLTGSLAVGFEPANPQLLVGSPVIWKARIAGPVSTSIWDFGDGTLVTNQPAVSHQWTKQGRYTMVLTAFNKRYPQGVSAIREVEVVEHLLYYVSAVNPTPAFPYATWESAANGLQDAVDAALPGGVVLVTNGSYASVIFRKPITVTSVNGPLVTLIDGGATNRCALLGTNAILSGFTLINGVTYGEDGAGVWCDPSAVVKNCVITRNLAAAFDSSCGGTAEIQVGGGGGAYRGTLYNCTLTGNVAFTGCGGGVYGSRLYNCILYYNDDAMEGINMGGENYVGATLSYSCTTPLPEGEGNIDTDPAFVDAAAGDLRLRYGSPCIDTGTTLGAILTNNLAGNSGSLDGNGDGILAFDMGAYEFVPPSCYVWQDSPNSSSPFNTWVNAAHTIQEAVGAAGTGDTVLVTNGVYASVLVNKSITVTSVNGPTTTVIDGYGRARCAALGKQAALTGFTLLNGVTYARDGAGVWCDSSAVVRNCVIAHNVAHTIIWYDDNGFPHVNPARGGGVSGGTLYNCALIGNEAGLESGGGGAYSSILYNCTLTSNSAPFGGGAYSSILFNCVVYYNGGGNYADSRLSYSCTAPMPEGEGNIDADPAFVNLAAGDFHLRYGSPCIDAGTNLSALITDDLVRSPRPLDGNGDGIAAFDMGAYEFNATALPPADWLTAHGLDPANPQVLYEDPDHDGQMSCYEWEADTNPNDPNSCLRISAISPGSSLTISLWTSAARLYSLLYAPNPTGGPWLPVPTQTDIPGNDGILTLIDPAPTAPRFYRVSVRLP